MIRHLYISPQHIYFGHHGKPAGTTPMQEVNEIECVAGHGIKGDRFYSFKPDYKGQITFFAEEVYQGLCKALKIERPPSVFRRNIITYGVDLDQWIGKEFEIQGVSFLGTAECSPCYWMNSAFGPGAEEWLKGRGGLRAKILTSGRLRRD